MRYHPYLLKGDDQAELETVDELSQLPILWPAIPDLIPCHRLTLLTGPSGVGLTDLACRLLAQIAPVIPHARLQAQQFLTELLAKGSLPVGNHKKPPENSIRAQVIAAGLSWGTIRRAATEMNLRIFRTADCWYSPPL